jgi:hypothetical protein
VLGYSDLGFFAGSGICTTDPGSDSDKLLLF